jgi:O-antigen/teichoic acid export membrane protein
MRPRLVRRRAATALGSYTSTALGILGSVVAMRVLEPFDFGRLTLVLATVGLFQLMLDLTSDEALVKYGFRYSERGDWARFGRLLRVALAAKSGSAVLAGLLIVATAPLTDALFDVDLAEPLLIASVLPLLYSFESTAASMLVLRGRYDVRAWFLTVTMGVRLVAIVLGAPHGVTATVVALVLGQVVATSAIATVGLLAVRRFPSEPALPLGDDRPEILRFVLHSSLGTGLVSLRGWIAPILLGIVSDVRQVGFFRAAQAPLQGFTALTAPVRLVMLTEQTRDWERGRRDVVLEGVRRYSYAAAALMVVAVPIFWWLMPDLIRIVLTERYLPAVDAARVMLLAAAVQLVYGWTKSFPVSIGRPGLRNVALAVEAAVFVPLLLVFGAEWGATGGAAAMVVSTAVFCLLWVVLLTRVKGEHLRAEAVPG